MPAKKKAAKRAAPTPRRFAVESVSAHVGATVAAVGIGAVIADSGALAAGDYKIHGHLGADGVAAAGKAIVLEHRDAANAATLKQLGRCPFGSTLEVYVARITLAANERIRAIGGSVAGGAGENATAHFEVIAIPS